MGQRKPTLACLIIAVQNNYNCLYTARACFFMPFALSASPHRTRVESLKRKPREIEMLLRKVLLGQTSSIVWSFVRSAAMHLHHEYWCSSPRRRRHHGRHNTHNSIPTTATTTDVNLICVLVLLQRLSAFLRCSSFLFRFHEGLCQAKSCSLLFDQKSSVVSSSVVFIYFMSHHVAIVRSSMNTSETIHFPSCSTQNTN